MVVIMKPNATHEDIDKVVSRIESAGLQAQKSTGLPKSNLAMVGGSIIDDKNALPSKNLLKKKTNPDMAQSTAVADTSKFYL